MHCRYLCAKQYIINTMKIYPLLLSLLCSSAMCAETLHLSTPSTSLVLDATPGNRLSLLHYGARVTDADIKISTEASTPTLPTASIPSMKPP